MTHLNTLCGFNFQWLFSWQPDAEPQDADLKALDFMANQGFNFARLACDYRFWTKNGNYFKPDLDVFEKIRTYVEACQERGIHLSLNMHRVPGYCINRPEIERHNLWQDEEAQDGFTFQWHELAKFFRDVSADALSFDLVNEPPNIGQYGMTRDVHSQIIRRVFGAVRAADSKRPIVIDGLEGGHTAMPELADLDVVHSGRGYQPMPVTHQGAGWWDGWHGYPPVYPGGNWQGHEWNREELDKFYQPWHEVEAMGRPIHMGEFGCYNQTPNDVALRWFEDLLSLWREYGWGWALWGFEGAFGIVDHGRPGANLVEIDGYKVDIDLLSLLKP